MLTEARAGIVIKPGDDAAMANAIIALRDDPERAKEMGQSGRRFVKTAYSRELTARRIEEALRDIVSLPAPAEDVRAASRDDHR